MLSLGTACAVTPVPLSSLVQHKANYFDLDGKRILFAPKGSGYATHVDSNARALARGEPLDLTRAPEGKLVGMALRGYSWRVPLPFPFPFAGKKWDEVYINTQGSLTFGEPETKLYTERETWADGTMRSVAAALDVRAVMGRERMIAPFWGLNAPEGIKVFVASAAREFVVTWDSIRYQFPNEAYKPLGRNAFQAHLTRDGAIEFRYQGIAEKDGITGVFTGAEAAGKRIHHVGAQGPVAAFDIYDDGAAIRFAFTMNEDVPERLVDGSTTYFVELQGSQGPCKLGLNVTDKGRFPGSECPAYAHGEAHGRVVTLYFPKLALMDAGKLSVDGTVAAVKDSKVSLTQLFKNKMQVFSIPEPLESGFDLSRSQRRSGNIYEVFHYPSIAKSRESALKAIYRTVKPDDDLAIVVTDFRIDDLHNHGSSTGAVNVRVEGIGKEGAEAPGGKESFGSTILQSAAGPIYLGPRFAETVRDEKRTYKNYAFAVGWMAHELTHRWGIDIKPDMLVNTECHCHWSDYTLMPVMFPVARMFTDDPYPEHSIMAASAFDMRTDGTFERRDVPWGVGEGLSALDLYLMGMISAEEVPDTLVIGDPKELGNNLFSGTKIPVSIAEVVASSGVRKPGGA